MNIHSRIATMNTIIPILKKICNELPKECDSFNHSSFK